MRVLQFTKLANLAAIPIGRRKGWGGGEENEEEQQFHKEMKTLQLLLLYHDVNTGETLWG